MRIERTGPVEPLTPRFEQFLQSSLSGQSLDDVQSVNDRRADFVCLRGLLAVEIKSLEDSPSERMDNLFDELRQRDDWPIFLGSAPAESFIKNLEDSEAVRRDVTDRVGRGVINPMKKANRQLKAHEASFPRSSVVRLMVLINEDEELYDPHTVSYILWHAVRKRSGGKQRFTGIDAIMYLTERHATMRGEKVVFPVVTVEASGVYYAPWKSDVIQFVADRWSALSYGEKLEADSVEDCVTIDHIPENAPKYERWKTDYLRKPYLQKLTREELQIRFDEVSLLATLPMLKDTPLKLSPEAMQLSMSCWQDMMLEMADRAIPITEFPHSADRAIAAAKRLKLAPNVISWVERFERKTEARNNSAKKSKK